MGPVGGELHNIKCGFGSSFNGNLEEPLDLEREKLLGGQVTNLIEEYLVETVTQKPLPRGTLGTRFSSFVSSRDESLSKVVLASRTLDVSSSVDW